MLFVLVCFLILNASSALYNAADSEINLWLCAAAFCPVDDMMTRKFIGPTTGFVVTKAFSDIVSSATGFIGYLPSSESIYVAFRGSDSARNWYSDLKVKQVNYTSFPDCECEVAEGFYNAEQSVIGLVVSEVKSLKKQFPNYSVMVTGHSYGAAVSQLTAMDLIAHGIPCTNYNFGQPRTGSAKYASYVGTKSDLTTYRVVHNQDIVPHWPFEEYLNYSHVCTEVFEDAEGTVRTCSATVDYETGYVTCEDPTCADQFDPIMWKASDHMTYLGLYIDCESVTESYM